MATKRRILVAVSIVMAGVLACCSPAKDMRNGAQGSSGVGGASGGGDVTAESDASGVADSAVEGIGAGTGGVDAASGPRGVDAASGPRGGAPGAGTGGAGIGGAGIGGAGIGGASEASADGGTGAQGAPAPGSGPADFYAYASSTCANMALRSTGRIRYFCDCQTGAQDGCVAGSDSNHDAFDCDVAHPCQTWTQAVKTFNEMNAGDTIALCKGGRWNVPAGTTVADGNCGSGSAAPALANARCAAGANLTDPANTSTCDLRDYQAPWGGTAKPVLYAYQTGPTNIINVNSNLNGVRILNLEFRGGNRGPRGGTSRDDYHIHRGIGLGLCNTATTASWLVCNNAFTNFLDAIEWGDLNTSAAQVIWGNRFTMNDLDALLGNPGNDGRIDANFFDNNGGFTPHPVAGNQAHSLYLAARSGVEVSNVQVVNNEFRRSLATSTAGACNAVVLVGHCFFTNLLVENNLIDAGDNAEGGCWDIDLRAAGSPPTHYRNMTIRRNWIQGGGLGISVGQAPGVVIENNVISLTGSGAWKLGIATPQDVARSGQDDVENDSLIRNNTIYVTGPAGNYTGISVAFEGTGHVIANNAVYLSSGTCFDTPLAAGAYAFIGNNACHGGTSWGTTYDATPHITADPMFTLAPTNFKPAAGSPLLGAATAAYAARTDFTTKTRPGQGQSIGAYEP